MATCNCSDDSSSGESILESVKDDIGASEWDDAFDKSLIRYINTTFMILSQLGVGPEGGFKITGSTETWEDFNDSGADIEAVKTMVSKRVKLMFDPAQSSFLNDADKAIVDELEWRLNVAVDPDLT